MNAREIQSALDAAVLHLVTALKILDDHRTGEIAAAHITYALDLLRGNIATNEVEVRALPRENLRLSDRRS